MLAQYFLYKGLRSRHPLCDWLGMNIAITTSLKWGGGEDQREKFYVESIRRSVFFLQNCPFYELLTGFIHKMT